MQILFLTPYPLSHIRIRPYGFVKHLRQNHEVTVLSLCVGKREHEDIIALQHEGIHVIPVYGRRSAQILRSLAAFPTSLPLQVAFCAAPILRATLKELIDTNQFDVLHIEFIRALGVIPDRLPLPTVWDAVDCISQLYEQGARFGATPMMRVIGQREAVLTRSYEIKQLQRFQHVLVTSERDRQALLDLATNAVEEGNESSIAKITALPHGIDQDYFRPYSGPRHSETLVFSGKMSFHANIAGVSHFVKRILPHIWRERPNTRLVIAGSNPPSTVRRFASDPRIEVTGYLPDLRPVTAKAQVAVCALPYAVGIQNKILEAMALGTPVVTTSNAAAGLQAVAGQDLLVADEPEAFAQAVLRLLDDPTLWTSLSEHGSAYIAAQHDWESVTRDLTTVYEQAIQDYAYSAKDVVKVAL